MNTALIAASALFAAVELVWPTAEKAVALVPPVQKKVMAIATYEERLEMFQKDLKNGKVMRHDKFWGRAEPLILKWRATAGEEGPWRIDLGRRRDLSDARVEYAKSLEANADGVFVYELPRANLLLGETYYWRVTSSATCKKGWHGRKCDCKDRPVSVISATGSFTTEDIAPRWIEIEGTTRNFRDLGGWKTVDGREVRQRLAYRCQGLNSNSPDFEIAGRNRLTVEDVKYLTGKDGLRIKTDLDLRSKEETAGMNGVSPLGEKVKFIHHSSQCYDGIFTEAGKATMAKNFRVFVDKANYPIVFHCIGGADRTGSLAYVLNGVLGVSRHDLETDWEQTFYPRSLPELRPDWKPPWSATNKYWCHEYHFNEGFAKYGKPGDSWNRRIELYLLDCGITPEEIATFRSIMLK